MALLSVFLVAFATTLFAAEDRPNIVVIMSDDMGFSDCAPYGGEIETPALQRLADGGLRFTQFYNTARCCPTRASLLTGVYPHQAGIGWMMTDLGSPGYRGDLSHNCVTIAEVLKTAGYATYIAGKWHVTPHVDPKGDKSNWPLSRGFDRFYGTLHGSGSYFDPGSLMRDNDFISPFADPEYKPETYYYTDAISDQAARFLHEHANHPRAEATRPFFLYVAYTAPHWPLHALEEDIAKYKGKYDAGYESVRQARFDRMKKMRIVSADCEIGPTAWKWNRVKDKAREARCMEVYAAMIDRMDQGIAKIVKELEANGQLDNTLILFLQDNGACAEDMSWFTWPKIAERPAKPTLARIAADEILTVQHTPQTREGFPIRMGAAVMPGPADAYVPYREGWANVSNTPFREYKHWVHEGGISTPLIAHWPKGIARKGDLERQPGHLIDLMATCVDIAKADYPKEFGGQAIKPLEGKSLTPAFVGRSIERDAIYFEHEGNRAIRAGKWKLVAKDTAAWELYDMEQDRAELHDLASQSPDRVRQLSAKWDAWAARAEVLPLGAWHEYKGPNTGYKKGSKLKGQE